MMSWSSLFSSIKDFFARFFTKKKRLAKPAASPPAPLPEPDVAPAILTVRQDEDHPSSAYTELKHRFRDIGKLSAIAETLGRDFLTAMPEGAWKSRLGQISFLHVSMHQNLTSVDMAKLIDRAKNHREQNPSDWDIWDSANLREMEDMYRSNCQVSADLIEEKSLLSYKGRRVHRDTLAGGDWPQAREFLSKTIDLNNKIAEGRAKASGSNSLYQTMMDEYVSGYKLAEVNEWFGKLEKGLGALYPAVLEKQKDDPPVVPIDDFYPAKAQMWLNRAMLSAIGFDFRRGGLFETGHNPVEGGTPDDTRLVIKNVDTENFLVSLKSTLHEGGHGVYNQGLPRKTWRYQPVAQDLGSAVHESQALLTEMIIGRTKAFFSFLSPRIEGLFHGLQNPVFAPDNLDRIKTRVQPGLIRTKADEITYFYHILLRFRLEQELVEGKLKVADLPEAWNNGMEEMLGIRPHTNEEGCMQDVHWFVAKFGYFPAYTIGHMIAAQLWHKILEVNPKSCEQVANGNFSEIKGWLNENIHSKGRLYSAPDLIKNVTGKPLGTEALLKHLRSRYLEGAAA